MRRHRTVDSHGRSPHADSHTTHSIGDAERSERLVLTSCNHLQHWVSWKKTGRDLGLYYSYKLGEADGVGTILRIASSGDADGKFSPEALDDFRSKMDRWSDEVLNSLNTQSVIVSLMLTVYIPLLLSEVSYGPGGASAIAAFADAQGQNNAAWGDLPSIVAPDDPWWARRHLYVAECALLSLAIVTCFIGLLDCSTMSDLLHALPSPILKADYMLRSLHGFHTVHMCWVLSSCVFGPFALAVIAARYSAVVFFCMLLVPLAVLCGVARNYRSYNGIYLGPIEIMYEEAEAILSSKIPAELRGTCV